MNRRRWSIAFVVAVVSFAGAWASAQLRSVVPVPPTVLSGGNIGFRVEGYSGDIAVGKLVVQVNGKWLETEFSGGVRRLSQ
jgi:hypothetical protein